MAKQTQIMLVVPSEAELIEPLAQAVSEFDVAAILVTPPNWQCPASAETDPDTDGSSVSAFDPDVCGKIVEHAKAAEIAVLIANDVDIAVRLRTDGCHLDATNDILTRYNEARGALGSDSIIGVAPGLSRHAAMTLAEAGADYVGFPTTSADDQDGLEFIGWWAEIFESPVVAFSSSDIAVAKAALLSGPPDFLALPPTGCQWPLTELAALISEHGAFPAV